jgi:hypothetical protein
MSRPQLNNMLCNLGPRRPHDALSIRPSQLVGEARNAQLNAKRFQNTPTSPMKKCRRAPENRLVLPHM